MTDAQTWTILIGLLTATAAMFGFMWRLVTQTIDARFNSIDHKFDGLGFKIDDLGRRASLLEDDVRAITRHLFNGPEAA